MRGRAADASKAEKAGAFALAFLHHHCAGPVTHPFRPSPFRQFATHRPSRPLACPGRRLHPTPTLRRRLSAKVLRPGIRHPPLGVTRFRATGPSTLCPAPDLSAHLSTRPCGPALDPAPFGPQSRRWPFSPRLGRRPVRSSGTWRLHCGLPPLAGPSSQRPCFRSCAAPPMLSVFPSFKFPWHRGPGGGQRFLGRRGVVSNNTARQTSCRNQTPDSKLLQ